MLKKDREALQSALSALLHATKTGYLGTCRLRAQNTIKMVPERFISNAGGTLKFPLVQGLARAKEELTASKQMKLKSLHSARSRGAGENLQTCHREKAHERQVVSIHVGTRSAFNAHV